MEALTKDDLRTLINHPAEVCLSLFMPTHRYGEAPQQDPIRLKNLLRNATEQLIRYGLRRKEAEELISHAYQLLNDWPLGANQDDGLALFAAPGLFRSYHLPFTPEELIMINTHFYVTPLLPVLHHDNQFYILALSQKHIRLLACSRYKAQVVHIPNMPQNIQEALQFDNVEKQLQYHTSGHYRGGPRNAIFHGQDVEEESANDNLLRYFRQVDHALHSYLRDKHVPLVLAGVEYVLPVYRNANTYPHVLDEGIIGNPDHLSAPTLHSQAWELLVSFFTQEQQQLAQRYYAYTGAHPQRVSHELNTIVPAAYCGRVDTLFVAVNARQWGKYDPQQMTVRIHNRQQPGDTDLLEVAAIQTVLNNGTVYAVSDDAVPEHTPVAAIFRY